MKAGTSVPGPHGAVPDEIFEGIEGS